MTPKDETLRTLTANGTVVPESFGDGWMTDNASDLAKIACGIAGFDPKELVLRLHQTRKRSNAKINTRTLERVLGEMSRDS